MNPELQKSLPHNLRVNLLDGGFFGLALGFASFVTILPLFVSTMTDSAMLIGLIPAIHSMGWQLPQLLLANRVSRLRQFRPAVLLLTTQERLPFLALALVAWLIPQIGKPTALWITFFLLVWQGLGGGLTANPWQSMIAKIIPADRRGTFFGLQAAASNLLSCIGAVLAGYILDSLPSPLDFVLCFLLASLGMALSWYFLAQTHEPESPLPDPDLPSYAIRADIPKILKTDRNFRWFLVARILSQVAVLASAFYTVFAVRHHGMSEVNIGYVTGVYLASQIIANPLMGWIGDRWSHRLVMAAGMMAAILAALLAWWAPSGNWFFIVFALAGIANVAVWTIALAMTLEYGSEAQRPAYIGLSNTLVAPMTFLAPFMGGLLADQAGYPAAFVTSAAGGVLTLVVLLLCMRDPS